MSLAIETIDLKRRFGRTEAVNGLTLDHATPGALERIRTAYPGADITTSPLSLRDICLALSRHMALKSAEHA